jgi:hypothetical protein
MSLVELEIVPDCLIEAKIACDVAEHEVIVLVAVVVVVVVVVELILAVGVNANAGEIMCSSCSLSCSGMFDSVN